MTDLAAAHEALLRHRDGLREAEAVITETLAAAAPTDAAWDGEVRVETVGEFQAEYTRRNGKWELTAWTPEE